MTARLLALLALSGWAAPVALGYTQILRSRGPARWPGDARIVFTLNSSFAPNNPPELVAGALRSSFSFWNTTFAANGIGVRFVDGGSTSLNEPQCDQVNLALFVGNHMSSVDALFLIASTDRFIRFLMFADHYHHPLPHPFARVLRAIPISSQLRPREMIRSLRGASEAVRAGEVVCIFAEGRITRIGQLLSFRRGMERIMKGVDAPIIPVHLDGVWGSVFSFEKGRFLWKWPQRIPDRTGPREPLPAHFVVLTER